MVCSIIKKFNLSSRKNFYFSLTGGGLQSPSPLPILLAYAHRLHASFKQPTIFPTIGGPILKFKNIKLPKKMKILLSKQFQKRYYLWRVSAQIGLNSIIKTERKFLHAPLVCKFYLLIPSA